MQGKKQRPGIIENATVKGNNRIVIRTNMTFPLHSDISIVLILSLIIKGRKIPNNTGYNAISIIIKRKKRNGIPIRFKHPGFLRLFYPSLIFFFN